MTRCGFCGRYREDGDDPHPNQDECPHRSSHGLLPDGSYPDDTLFEAITNTMPRDSIALRGWDRAYPSFKPVLETRTWTRPDSTLPPVNRECEFSELTYWKKTIWAKGNRGRLYRIEYDPTTSALIVWYELAEESEEELHSGFETFLRKASSDVSYFGSSLSP
jgi:hypothetical protein